MYDISRPMTYVYLQYGCVSFYRQMLGRYTSVMDWWAKISFVSFRSTKAASMLPVVFSSPLPTPTLEFGIHHDWHKMGPVPL